MSEQENQEEELLLFILYGHRLEVRADRSSPYESAWLWLEEPS